MMSYGYRSFFPVLLVFMSSLAFFVIMLDCPSCFLLIFIDFDAQVVDFYFF